MVTTRTACSYCGVGCGIEVQTTTDSDTGRPVIARVSGDKLHPTNYGRLCTKGATHAEMMAADDGRLTSALLRPARDEELVPTPVDDAVAEAGRRLRAIVDEHGPDAVALYVSGQMSIEAQYLANKLAKGSLRTVHIESNSRLCMASAGTGFKQSLGADGPPGSYTDFDCTELFFVIGSNMADCHPILYLRMADRLKAGAKLIVVDPRRTTTAEKADLFLQIKPGTDLALLNGLLHLLVENGDIDAEFIAEHTDGWEAMAAFVEDYPPDRVALITSISEKDTRTAARMIADAREWMSCWTMGLNQSTHGTWNTNAICNLHLATGAICRPGSGPMSLTGQPNAMGGREMGYMGAGLPGQRSVVVADDRAFVEQQWALAPGTIRSDVGPGTIEMFEGLGRRRDQGVLDHLHQSCCHRRESEDGDHRPGECAARHRPGHLPRDGDESLRRHRAACHAVGRIRRRHGEFGAQPDLAAAVHRACRTSSPGLAADLSGRRAHGLRRAVPLRVQ